MDQLREFYERQDSEELLEISKKQLTEEARIVMNGVLAARGIDDSVIGKLQEEAIEYQERLLQARSTLGSRRARLVGYAIDEWGVGSSIFLVLLPLKSVDDRVYMGIGACFWMLYMLFRDCVGGQSVGKRVMGLGVVSKESGRPSSWPRSLLRNLTQFLFWFDAIFILGEGRARLGDLIAGTQVVRTE